MPKTPFLLTDTAPIELRELASDGRINLTERQATYELLRGTVKRPDAVGSVGKTSRDRV